jgi:trimeric autotransporter adhesin
MTTIRNLRLLIIILACAISLSGNGEDGFATRTHKLSDPQDVPEGLAKSDWQSIRAAYEAGRHAIMPVEGGCQARNPGQQWTTKFDGSGFTVTPDTGDWSWGLELEGHGEVLEVQRNNGKVSYLREDGVTEWFVNDSRGLEQGWTLTKRPEREEVGAPFCLELSVLGTLRPQVSEKGDSVVFLNESGGATLTYGGLRA